MKKHTAILLLFSLLMLSMTYAGILFFSNHAGSSSIHSTSTDCFNPNVGYPGEGIERYNTAANIGSRVQQFIKKFPGLSAGSTGNHVRSTFLPSSVIFQGVRSLNNNCLSYNYPSHNFW